MKAIRILRITSQASLLLILFSCDEYLSIDVPDSQLSSEVVFSDSGTAEAALLDVYAKLRNTALLEGSSTGMSVLLGNASDELTCYSTTGSPEEFFYQNNVQANQGIISQWWNNAYSTIYSANSVMEGLNNSQTIPQSIKDKLYGEALFARSLIHFYLLNLFGDIPYVTTTNYGVNQSIGKLSSEALYPMLINDVLTSIDLLPEDYPNPERIRVNRGAARAFLARMYLYRQNYEAAQQQATMVIGDPLYSWNDDLDTVFLPSSTATIWQLQPTYPGEGTLEAQSFIFTSAPPPNRALSPSLISAFESGDQRFIHWIGNVTNGLNTYYYPYKYRQQDFQTASQEYSIILRLSEIYLIRAEALARQGEISAAALDLNKIRLRAGLPAITASSQQDIITAILQERRVELFSEHGHRWFDLVRTGTANSTLATQKLGWNSNDILFPLPENELLLNPNLLPQNPGY